MFGRRLLKKRSLISKKLLADFPSGTKVKIVGLYGGPWLRQRLHELGLFEGAEIIIVKNDRLGPVILKVFNSKIAVGRKQARRIYVQKI